MGEIGRLLNDDPDCRLLTIVRLGALHEEASNKRPSALHAVLNLRKRLRLEIERITQSAKSG